MSLKTLFNRLDEWLDELDEMPIVNNPVDDDENFNRHWDEDKFQNFKKQVKKYNGWIKYCLPSNGIKKSLLKGGERYSVRSLHLKH